MLKVDKTPEPTFFTEFNALRNSGDTSNNWQELGPPYKEPLYEHLLKKEQKEYCPYCERKIYYDEMANIKSYRIEHIYPRNPYSDKTFEYENLIVCCNGEGEKSTCDVAKGNKFDEVLFINPVKENPTDHLYHSLSDGKIEPLYENCEKSIYTIKLLNLNDDLLVRARIDFVDVVLEKSYELESFDVLKEYSETENFPTLCQQLLENHELIN